MKIEIIGKQMNVYESTKQLVERKLAKLDKYFRPEACPEAVVTMSRKRNVSRMEVTINAGGTLFRSEVDDEDFRTALDRTIDRIEGQIRKNKTKFEKRLRDHVIDLSAVPDPEEPEAEDLIIRVKQFELRPVTPEEAVMQMKLLGHSFYVFADSVSGETCVVYTRKDGAYGLIEPMR